MSRNVPAARLAVFVLALTGFFALAIGQSAASGPAGAGLPTAHRGVCPKHSAHTRCVASYRRASNRRSTDTSAPNVSWKAPTAGTTVKGTIQGKGCEVAAGDNRGVTKVVFKIDGSALNTETAAPWNCGFDTAYFADGSHTLTATAYDAAGNSRSTSTAVIFANAVASTPAPAPTPEPTPAPTPEPTPAPTPSPEPTPTSDVTPPSLAWMAPAAGSTVKGQASGSACEVSASDPSGVAKVVFKVDGSSLNTEIETPWNCTFDSTKVADGTHTLTATAYDKLGNWRSLSTTVTVSNAVAPTPEPTPTPAPTSSPAGMIVGLDAGSYGLAGAQDVRGAVNTVRYDSERGVTALENFRKAGLRIQMVFPGPYNSGGVCALNATNWVANSLSFYKTNTNPTETPTIEVLNEPGGSWFWGSGAEGSTNAVCYRNLLKKTHEAFHAQYGDSAPKILGTLDGPNGLTFGKAWLTSDWATYVDGFIVHPYGGTGSKSSSALGNRAVIESARALTHGPIYITEVGWPTATGQPATGDSLQWTESEQATNITNFIAWCHDTGYVAEVVYFNYHDFGTNSWYGVVRNDGSHKPSYDALRQAAAKYGV